MSERQEKVSELLKELAAQFWAKRAEGGYLLSVTGCEIGNDLKKAKLLITVLPEEKEKTALEFAKDLQHDLYKYLQEKLRMKFIPRIEVEIDLGEKNRQRIEAISHQK